MLPSIPLAATILLCYLLTQTIALRLRLIWRRRFDALAEELIGDSFLPIPHWRKVEFYKTASLGGWATLRRLARTPARVIYAGRVTTVSEADVSTNPIEVKLRELHALAAKLEWATHPVGFALVVAVSAPLLPLGRAIAHSRGITHQLSVSAISRAASEELRSAAEAAYDRMLKPRDLLALTSAERTRRRGHPRG